MLLLFACTSEQTDLALEAVLLCSEVVDGLEEERQVVAETFGDGAEGRDAQQAIAEAIEARPDCFAEEDVAFARELREMLPSSDAEVDALRRAEEACGGSVGEQAVSGPGGPTHGTPEQALEGTDTELPGGAPERSFEGDGRVAFDYRDGAGFRGWVLVQQSIDGWFVRRVINCGGG